MPLAKTQKAWKLSNYTIGQIVWDFPTQRWAKIVKIISHDGDELEIGITKIYVLDDSIPLNEDHPSNRNRCIFEIGTWPDSDHGIIFSEDTLIVVVREESSQDGKSVQ